MTTDTLPGIVVYGATWCGHCHRLRGQLDRQGMAHESVDVDEHPQVLALLGAVNDGAWILPTVVVNGRTVLVNPSVAQVEVALAGMAIVTPAPAASDGVKQLDWC